MAQVLAKFAATFALSAVCATSTIAVAAVSPSLPPPDAPRASTVQEYLIGPMDTLDISVFQVNDLSRTVEVDGNGQITLPLIGAMNVAGKSTQTVSNEIAAKLSDGYVLSPQVSVTVKDSPNRRVTVEGSVTQPGVYPISGRTTLLQAVALARGADSMANERHVAVFRTVQNRRAVAIFDLDAIRQGKADDPEIYGNDVVVVERSGAKSFFGQLRSVVPMMGIFRWF
jgi:polysaccharide export outer membrane protein